MKPRHHLVLQPNGRTAATLERWFGIDEARPNGGWPNFWASICTSSPVVAGQMMDEDVEVGRAQTSGKNTPEVIVDDAIEILLEHDTAGDPSPAFAQKGAQWRRFAVVGNIWLAFLEIARPWFS
jgi:hypothetical protein